MTSTQINASNCYKLFLFYFISYSIFLFYFISYSIESKKWTKDQFLHRHSIWLDEFLPYTFIWHANQVLHKNFDIWKYFISLSYGFSTLLRCQHRFRLGYCLTPYQRQWLYNGAPLVAFHDTLGIRRTYSCQHRQWSFLNANCKHSLMYPWLSNLLKDRLVSELNIHISSKRRHIV